MIVARVLKQIAISANQSVVTNTSADDMNVKNELLSRMKQATGVVVLKSYREYFDSYAEKGTQLMEQYEPGALITGENNQVEFIKLYGEILKLRNNLTSFDDFANEELLSERDRQDYHSTYLDLWNERKRAAQGEKESNVEDVVFEIELIKQVEINVDYILLLVQKFREERGDGDDKELRAGISRAIDSSPTLRNKKDLIENFVDSVSNKGDVEQEWCEYVAAQREKELAQIIASENLKPEETARFIQTAFRDKHLRTTGTALTKVLPPVSRFSKDKNHSARKHRVIQLLGDFFDRFLGLGSSIEGQK